MQNTAIKKLFEKRYKEAKAFRKGFEPAWQILTELYHLVDKKHPNWDFVDFLKDYADSIGVRWDAGIFAGRSFFGLKGKPSKFNDNAVNMAELIQMQAEEESGLLALLRNSLIPLSYLGNVILKGGWQGVAPSFSDIPLMDFWPRPKSSGIDNKLGWCIYRSKYTLKELRQLEEDGTVQDIDNIVNFVSVKQSTGNEKEGDDMTLEARGVNLNSADDNSASDKGDMDKEYTILHMWEQTRFVSFEESSMEVISVPDMQVEKEGMLNKVANAVGIGIEMDGWTNNDNVDDKGAPYFPFVLLRPIPEKGVFYGLSPVEAHITLQYEFNENRHQKRITTDIIKKGLFLYRRGNNIDETRLETAAVIKGDAITEADIRRLDVGGPELVSIFERDEDRITQIGDKAAGIYDPQRGGGEGDVTKTVGGLTLLINEGNLKFKRHITNIHIDGLRPLVMMCVWLNQQFLGDEVIEVMIKGQPADITGEQITGSFKYEMTSAPGLGQQEAQQTMLTNLIGMYTTNPALQPLVKINELAKEHLRLSDLDPVDVMWSQEEQNLIAENEQLRLQVEQLTTPVQQAVEQPVKERMMV